jgi:hypothetical protein
LEITTFVAAHDVFDHWRFNQEPVALVDGNSVPRRLQSIGGRVLRSGCTGSVTSCRVVQAVAPEENDHVQR